MMPARRVRSNTIVCDYGHGQRHLLLDVMSCSVVCRTCTFHHLRQQSSIMNRPCTHESLMLVDIVTASSAMLLTQAALVTHLY